MKELGYIDREPEWDRFVNTKFLDEATSLPPRVLVARTVIALLVIVAGWAVWVLPRAVWLPMTPTGKKLLAAAVVAVVLIAIAWIWFILPVYWD